MTSDTCIYLDMSVVIADIDEKDAHHDSVMRLLNGISDRRLAFRLTLVELDLGVL